MSTPMDGTVGLARLVQNASILRIATSVIVILLIRFFVRGFYRAYLSPLAHLPGPKISAATRIPSILASWKGEYHLYVGRLHEEYGDVVRITPDEVSFIDPQSWKDTQGRAASKTKGVKGSMPDKYWYRYGTSVNGSPSLINARNEQEHARMRRIFNPAFSERALKQQEPLFMNYVNQLVQILQEGIKEDPNRKFNLVKLYNFTTFDVMGDLTFGESLHMLDSGKYDPWVTNIFGSLRIGTKIGAMMHYPILWRLFKMLIPEKMMKKRYAHFQHSVERVTKRLEKGRESEGTDLWDLVLDQQEGKGLTRGEMDSNSSLFMIAGTETTATLVSGLTYLLIKNPDKYAKLKEEVRTAFQEQDMHMEAVAALPYLNACIKEALRVYPPVPNALPRQAAPDGSTVAGTYVPPGTIISVPHLAMYKSEKNFRRAREFIPERWLGDEEFKDDAKHALQPFHIGSRDCLGKNMAYHEMRLIMAKVVYNFDYEICPESDKWISQPTYTLWQKHPLMVKVRAANASQ
ncbi:cytochrome P450 [Polyplosphaeria fusca]|uniref:Cytochrome P450 n=1 Tax=Polyplosphaeria fusca TaxID=682080 RepID=A0A9P4QYA8_9PLEO|nr:cytochrome P450 [Polyplosphaeria fusca]